VLEVNFTVVLVFISLVPFVLLMKGLFFDPMLRVQAQREVLREQETTQSLSFVVATMEVKDRVTQALKDARKAAQAFMMQARQRIQQDIAQELTVFRTAQEAQVAQEKQVLESQFESQVVQAKTSASQLSDAIVSYLKAPLV
jgi:hypothetical protein